MDFSDKGAVYKIQTREREGTKIPLKIQTSFMAVPLWNLSIYFREPIFSCNLL